MRTEIEKAYLAGLLDGEGHIGITFTSPGRSGERWRTHFVIVTIAMAHQPLLQWLKETWPGGVLTGKKSAGYPMWALRWQSAKAADVLREALPYMRVKAMQATLAVQFADELAARPYQGAAITEAEWDRREALRLSIQSLNRPGKEPITPLVPFGAKAKEPLTCGFCGKEIPEYGSRKRKYCDNRCQWNANKDVYNARQRESRRQQKE